MDKDGSGSSAGKDAELDALLSVADTGMLDAIRDNLDLDTGSPRSSATSPGSRRPAGQRDQRRQNLAAALTVTATRLTLYMPLKFPPRHTRSLLRPARRPAKNRAISTGR